METNNSLLEYYKMILKKVSFDLGLLQKEYKKALQVVPMRDVPKLKMWYDQLTNNRNLLSF